jgi:hypothetical protein
VSFNSSPGPVTLSKGYATPVLIDQSSASAQVSCMNAAVGNLFQALHLLYGTLLWCNTYSCCPELHSMLAGRRGHTT